MLRLSIPADRPLLITFGDRLIRVWRGEVKGRVVIETDSTDITVNHEPLFRMVECDVHRHTTIRCEGSWMQFKAVAPHRHHRVFMLGEYAWRFSTRLDGDGIPIPLMHRKIAS